MTSSEFKQLYSKDNSTGCRSYTGPSKVWCEGRTWYPHLLLRHFIHIAPLSTGMVSVRTCDNPTCISPEHRHDTPRHTPIAPYQYTHTTTTTSPR